MVWPIRPVSRWTRPGQRDRQRDIVKTQQPLLCIARGGIKWPSVISNLRVIVYLLRIRFIAVYVHANRGTWTASSAESVHNSWPIGVGDHDTLKLVTNDNKPLPSCTISIPDYTTQIYTRSSAVAETVRCFVSLTVLLSHSMSFKMTPLSGRMH